MQTTCEHNCFIPAKSDQLEKIVPKLWGHEEWIVNNAQYCGKKLVFKNSGYACSLHFHKIKDETFYVNKGLIAVELEDGTKKWTRIMSPGDVQRIIPGIIHRIIALEPAEVMEFSTYHRDDDSYRIIDACIVDINKYIKKDFPG